MATSSATFTCNSLAACRGAATSSTKVARYPLLKSLKAFTTSTLTNKRASLVVVQAAKKGGGMKKGGSGGNKKGGGLVIPKKEPYLMTNVIMHNLLLIESYYRKTGRPLFEEEIEIQEAARALWDAPFAVLAHDTSTPEPLFVYANAAALALFETTWEELIGKPSSSSAEPVDEIQSDRSAALAQVEEKGVIDTYQGWRTSLQGTRFHIKDTTVFKVDAPSGQNQGMSAIIRLWEYEDGRQGGPNAEAVAVVGEAGEAPSDEDLAAAEAAVAEQGAKVRDLKEVQGLGNNDEAVKAAVAELLARKQVLEEMTARKKAAAAA